MNDHHRPMRRCIFQLSRRARQRSKVRGQIDNLSPQLMKRQSKSNSQAGYFSRSTLQFCCDPAIPSLGLDRVRSINQSTDVALSSSGDHPEPGRCVVGMPDRAAVPNSQSSPAARRLGSAASVEASAAVSTDDGETLRTRDGTS